MTRVIVAHRRETVATADRVVTLANGKIVAEQRIATAMSDVRGLAPQPDVG
jgi:ABC-type bacteriocin/lantibiotic exporter with double-glycine peptidase domain